GIQGISWSQYGIVFGQGYRSIMQISENGGEPKTLVKMNYPMEGANFPQVLPGGKAVLFSTSDASGDRNQIAVQSLVTGERKILIERKTGPLIAHYIDSGHLLF